MKWGTACHPRLLVVFVLPFLALRTGLPQEKTTYNFFSNPLIGEMTGNFLTCLLNTETTIIFPVTNTPPP